MSEDVPDGGAVTQASPTLSFTVEQIDAILKAGKDSKKAGKDARSLPKQYLTSTSEQQTSKTGLWPSTITDEQYAYLAKRSAIGSRVLTKQTDDCFSKWFELTGDETKIKAIEELNKKLKVKDNFAIAYRFAKIWGYSLISYGYVETGADPDADTQNLLTPTNVTDIEYIFPIAKEKVAEWDEDLDPTSETYGCITSYKIIRPDGDMEEKVEINAKRFYHWTNPNIYNTPIGMSMYEPLYNALGVSNENVLYGVAEAIWQNVSPMRTLTCPKWLYEYFTPEQQTEFIADLESKFKNFNVKQSWLLLPEMEMNTIDTDKGMNIKDHVDFIENQISAGTGISRYLLEGFPAGSISGSETNTKAYYLYIGGEQINFIEKALREFWTDQEDQGILPPGDYELHWNPIEEMTETEMIEITKLKGQSLVELGKGIILLQNAGWHPVIEEGELVVADVDGNVLGEDRRIPVEAPEPVVATPPVAPADNETAGEDKTHMDPAYIERYEDLTVNWSGYHTSFNGEITPVMRQWEEDWLKVLNKLFKKDIVAGEDRQFIETIKLIGEDDKLDLTRDISNTSVPSKTYEQTVLNEYTKIYDNTQALTVAQTVESGAVAFVPSTFIADDPQSRKWLSTQANLNYNNTDAQINKNVRAGLNQVLKTGVRIETEADVARLLTRLNSEVAKAFEKYAGNTANMIRTETANIVIQSRGESYKKMGLENARYEILVNADACPQCIPLIGNTYTLEQVLEILPVHNLCRCDYVPIVDATTQLFGVT